MIKKITELKKIYTFKDNFHVYDNKELEENDFIMCGGGIYTPNFYMLKNVYKKHHLCVAERNVKIVEFYTEKDMESYIKKLPQSIILDIEKDEDFYAILLQN